MANGIGNPTHTDKLIYRLRLMADSGGMISKDRKKTIIESADRLEALSERIAIMSEQNPLPPTALEFPPGGDDKHD